MAFTKNNTLVILDWDNTLFPTTWVAKNFINLNDTETRYKYLEYFSELDDLIFNLFKKILYKSRLIIVTNAMPLWIKISSSVLPKTQNLLNYIKVISARKNFQKISSDYTEWKKLAFTDEVKNQLNIKNKQNIISIGDASYEYKALINLYNKDRILKSMKFLEEPTFDILKDQLEVVFNNIDRVIDYDKHLDLVFKNK
jgi:hypothetical protein